MCFNPDSKMTFVTILPNKISNKRSKVGTKNNEFGGKPVARITSVQVQQEKEEPIYANESMEWPKLTKPIHTDDLADHVKSINNDSKLLTNEYKVGNIIMYYNYVIYPIHVMLKKAWGVKLYQPVSTRP